MPLLHEQVNHVIWVCSAVQLQIQTSNSGYQPTSNTGSQTQQPARGGSKVGAAVAGVAAGALGGYMLGKAMNSHESGSSTTAQSNESTIQK